MGSQVSKQLAIEVVYAKPFEQKIVPLTVKIGTTIMEAVKMSGIVNFFPEIELDTVKFGIFGKVINKPSEQQVKEGDRVEIYRPLIADPREVRKKRAALIQQQK